MGAIINCQNGNSIIHGQPVRLPRNEKNHLIIDYVTHLFGRKSKQVVEPNISQKIEDRLSAAKGKPHTPPRVRFSNVVQSEDLHVLDMFPLDVFVGEKEESEAAVKCVASQFLDANFASWHLGVSSENFQFLLGQVQSRDSILSTTPVSSTCGRSVSHGPQGGSSEGSSRSPVRGTSQDRLQSPEGQDEQEQDRVRRDPKSRSGSSGPKGFKDSMAMLWNPQSNFQRQQVWKVGGMQSVCSQAVVCSSNQCASPKHPHGPTTERGGSIGPTEERWLEPRGTEFKPGESNDNDCGQGVPATEAEEEGRQWLQGEGSEEGFGEGNSRSRGGGKLRWSRELHGGVNSKGETKQEGEGSCFLGEAGLSRDGFADYEMVLDGPTCQRLLAATTEFNCGIIMGAMLDSFRPFRLWEVCCRADSSLSQACQKVGMEIERKTLSTGYDLNRNECIDVLVTEALSNPPDRAWFSLMCTAVTFIQNINQRNQRQIDDLRKKRQKCRRQLKGAIKIIWSILEASGGSSKFYFEWPKNAYHGWKMIELQNFIRHFEQAYGKLFFVQIDGCMHGVVCPEGWPLRKSWVILTNDSDFRDKCQLCCDGSHQHRPGGIIGIGSKAVESTGFYPMSMVTAVARCWKSQWSREIQFTNKEIHNTLHSMEENYGNTEEGGADPDRMTSLRFPGEDKAGRDRAWSMLHQLHRAAGHPSNRSLARLCRDRGMPHGWFRWL